MRAAATDARADFPDDGGPANDERKTNSTKWKSIRRQASHRTVEIMRKGRNITRVDYTLRRDH